MSSTLLSYSKSSVTGDTIVRTLADFVLFESRVKFPSRFISNNTGSTSVNESGLLRRLGLLRSSQDRPSQFEVIRISAIDDDGCFGCFFCDKIEVTVRTLNDFHSQCYKINGTLLDTNLRAKGRHHTFYSWYIPLAPYHRYEIMTSICTLQTDEDCSTNIARCSKYKDGRHDVDMNRFKMRICAPRRVDEPMSSALVIDSTASNETYGSYRLNALPWVSIESHYRPLINPE